MSSTSERADRAEAEPQIACGYCYGPIPRRLTALLFGERVCLYCLESLAIGIRNRNDGTPGERWT